MTRDQFLEIIEIGQQFVSIVNHCKGVGVNIDSLAEINRKTITAYFKYVDPEERGLPVVMYFIYNGYYPIPDGVEIIELRDVSRLYDFWLICVENGNPAAKYITEAVTDYKKDLHE
jgi:hypothetical protein